MNYVKTISTSKDTLLRRVIKFLRYGKSDVQTSLQVAPAGIDSSPVKDMFALYGETDEKGKTAVMGYINKQQLAEDGEVRIYSQNSSGDLQTYLWVKKNGTMEFGGAVHNLVRYTPLNAGLQSEVNKINVELGKIAVALNAIVPGSYTVVPVSVDISASKIDELKTL